jgi:hypothetical protein
MLGDQFEAEKRHVYDLTFLATPGTVTPVSDKSFVETHPEPCREAERLHLRPASHR